MVIRRVLALLAFALVVSSCGEYTFRGGVIDPPLPAPDFTLTDASGQPFTLSAQRGNVVLMYFGFTNCPDMCPTALADMAAARKALGADGERVKGIFITLDPERDTPERLSRYMAAFDETFVGLYGSEAELAPVVKDYGVSYSRRDLPDSALEYTIDHSTFIYVIDPAGQWRVLFGHGTPVDDMVSDLRHLLRTGGA